jgi:hypothetical protein
VEFQLINQAHKEDYVTAVTGIYLSRQTNDAAVITKQLKPFMQRHQLSK